MAEPDVESEIYERLYGLPRRERDNRGPEEHPIVIVDGGIRAGTGADEAREGHVGEELRPAINASSSAVRRRPVIVGGLAVLVAVSLVALLVAAGASSETARIRLAALPPPHTGLASALPATPRTGRRRSPPKPTRSAAEASAGLASASGTGMDTAAIQHRRSSAHLLSHRAPTRRPKRIAPRPPRAAPIRQPTSHEHPAHPSPTDTTPGTPPAGTRPTTPGSGPNVTGGQPAPPE